MEEKNHKEIEREFVRNVQQEIKEVLHRGKIVFAVIAVIGALVLVLSFIL